MRDIIYASLLHFLLLFSSCPTLAANSVAQSGESFEITLDRRNHLGFQKIDILVKDKAGFYFDGKKIGVKLPAGIQSHWDFIENGPEAPKTLLHCSAGQFEYKKIKDKKTLKVMGCTEGVAYGNMISHLEALREYAKSL